MIAMRRVEGTEFFAIAEIEVRLTSFDNAGVKGTMGDRGVCKVRNISGGERGFEIKIPLRPLFFVEGPAGRFIIRLREVDCDVNE